MPLESGNKINRLLAEGIPNGLYFSEWLTAKGYSPQLLQQYRNSGWLEMLNRGVYYRVSDQLSAYAAIASSAKQTQHHLRLAAHSALELHGVMHFVPMGRPQAVVTSDKRRKMLWLQSGLFDRQFEYFFTPQLPSEEAELVTQNGLQLPTSSQELAILECLYLAPKRYSYMDVYYLMEQLSGLRPAVLQSLLERTTSYRVKRMFLYMAEKAAYPWMGDLDVSRIDLGTGTMQLVETNGAYISKYKITVPQELKEYE